jgi:hypothetical protein
MHDKRFFSLVKSSFKYTPKKGTPDVVHVSSPHKAAKFFGSRILKQHKGAHRSVTVVVLENGLDKRPRHYKVEDLGEKDINFGKGKIVAVKHYKVTYNGHDGKTPGVFRGRKSVRASPASSKRSGRSSTASNRSRASSSVRKSPAKKARKSPAKKARKSPASKRK